MRSRDALALYVGLGAVGYVGWQLFRAGAAIGPLTMPAIQPVAVGFLALFGAFASGALALVTLVPAALEARRDWLVATAALLPGIVLAFGVEQLEEAIVAGGAEAALSTGLLVALFALGAGVGLALRADERGRRRLAAGLVPAAALAAVSMLTRFGAAQVGALLVTAVLALGLALEWLRPRPSAVEPTAPEPPDVRP